MARMLSSKAPMRRTPPASSAKIPERRSQAAARTMSPLPRTPSAMTMPASGKSAMAASRARTRISFRASSHPGSSSRPMTASAPVIGHQGASWRSRMKRAGRRAQKPAPTAARTTSRPASRVRHRCGPRATASSSSYSAPARSAAADVGHSLMSTALPSGVQLGTPGPLIGESFVIMPCSYQERSISSSSGPSRVPSFVLTLYPFATALPLECFPCIVIRRNLPVRSGLQMDQVDVHIAAHTHWDREWYATREQFRLRLVDLVDRVLDRMDADPRFDYFHLDGQTIVLEDYLEARPEQEERLRRRIAEGRLLVGPWYVMPDQFLVSGEALVRNLALGHRIASRFGRVMPVGYIPDPFVHVSQMPT